MGKKKKKLEKSADKGKETKSSMIKQPVAIVVREPFVWIIPSVCLICSFLMYQVACNKYQFVNDSTSVHLMAFFSLCGAIMLILKMCRRKIFFETNYNSITYVPTIGKGIHLTHEQIGGFYAGAFKSYLCVVDRDGNNAFTIAGSMIGMNHVFQTIKKNPLYHEDSTKDENVINKAKKIDAIFTSLIIISVCVLFASAMCSRIIMNATVLTVSFACLTIFPIRIKYLANTSSRFNLLTYMALAVLATIYIAAISSFNYVINLFYLAFLLLTICMVLCSNLYSICELKVNIIWKILFVIILSIAISGSANYLFANASVVQVKIVDKYEITANKPHISKMLAIDDVDGSDHYIQISVSNDTFDDFDTGDTIELVRRSSIFSVTSYYDDVTDNSSNKRITVLGKSFNKSIVIFIAVAIGSLFSGLIVTGHGKQLLIIILLVTMFVIISLHRIGIVYSAIAIFVLLTMALFIWLSIP